MFRDRRGTIFLGIGARFRATGGRLEVLGRPRPEILKQTHICIGLETSARLILFARIDSGRSDRTRPFETPTLPASAWIVPIAAAQLLLAFDISERKLVSYPRVVASRPFPRTLKAQLRSEVSFHCF